MMDSYMSLYVDFNRKDRAFASMEELLEQIHCFLLFWVDCCLPGQKADGISPEPLYEYWDARCEKTRERSPGLPYLELKERLSLNRFEEFLVWLEVIRQLDGEFAQELQEKGFCAGEELTLEEAFRLFGALSPESRKTAYALLDSEYLPGLVLFRDWEEEHAERLLGRPLRLRKVVLDYLLEQDCGIPGLSGIVRDIDSGSEPLLHDEEQLGQCKRFLEKTLQEGKKGVLLVCGAEGTGKSFLLSRLSETAAFCPVHMAFLLERKSVSRDLREILSYCVLRGKYVCLEQLPAGMDGELLGYFLRLLTEHNRLVCVMSGQPVRTEYPREAYVLEVELAEASQERQRSFWEYFAQKYGCTALQGHGEELSGLYRLTIGEIEGLLRRVRSRFGEEREDYEAVREYIGDMLMEDAGRKLKGLAVPLAGGFTPEDLKLPGQQTRILHFAVSAIKNRCLVMEGMGFGKKMPYGRGISILLYGPPGTGKTMTAQVIAKQVGLTLFRVDASKIVDKYIGETEKKLGELFDTAKSTNAILFFDEADSLFAKRTEVSKSTDKYANNEVSFLLQLMEQYDGIMILATNHSNFFDEAFRRRITYSINLPAPDAETRIRLWQLAFPEGTEIAGDVDFDQLAREHEFTGSSIKYVAQQAMYTAAALQTPVTAECIYTGLKLLEERDCQGYKDAGIQACFTRLL